MVSKVEIWIQQEQGKHFCKCGCGGEIIIKPRHHEPSRGIPEYLHGHNQRGRKTSDDTRNKMSISMKQAYVDNPDIIVRRSEKQKQYFIDNPDVVKERNERNRQRYIDNPELRVQVAKKQRDLWEDEEFYEMMCNRIKVGSNTDESRERKSVAILKFYINKRWNHLSLNSLINGEVLKDFISIEKEYCYKFNNECKEHNREKFGRSCFICGRVEEENGEKLSVHHVDMNKNQGCNDIDWKLIPVCRSCHGTINYNNMWKCRIIWLLDNIY